MGIFKITAELLAYALLTELRIVVVEEDSTTYGQWTNPSFEKPLWFRVKVHTCLGYKSLKQVELRLFDSESNTKRVGCTNGTLFIIKLEMDSSLGSYIVRVFPEHKDLGIDLSNTAIAKSLPLIFVAWHSVGERFKVGDLAHRASFAL